VIAAAERGREAMDGWLYGVLRTGPYRGHMVFGREPSHRARAGGCSGNPVSVVSPSGEVVLLVPGSDKDDGLGSLATWLKEKGWMI
jgi:hypothetical protein